MERSAIPAPNGKFYVKHDGFEDGEIVYITLSPEYTVEVPLWPQSDDTDALVSPELLQRLIEWQSEFDSNFDPFTGWRSDEAEKRVAEQSLSLEADLRAELEGKAEVVVNLWCLKNPRRDLLPPRALSSGHHLASPFWDTEQDEEP